MNRYVMPVGLVTFALLLVWGCGGEGADASGGGSGSSAEDEVRETLYQDEPVDAELAARGETLFRNKGCVACHSIGGGRLVGPDLEGVTERRELEWIHRMIVSPDSMLRHDPTARELLAEYFTPMTDMQVKPDEARALIHFLRRDGEAPPAGS